MLVLIVGALIGAWFGYRWVNRGSSGQGADPKVEPFVIEIPPDPRLDPGLVWRNARPDVAYVGDQACQVCHEGICDLYHKSHPMARASSIAGKPDAAGVTGIELFGPKHHTSFEKDQIRFSIDQRADKRMHQKEEYLDESGAVIATREYPYTVAIGSGQRGRSYIFERDGWLFQTSMSWYTKASIWDISPGFQLDRENYGRPIHRLCLYCHINQATLVEGTANKFQPFETKNLGIGCERCHGPGKLHCDEHANDPTPLKDKARNRVSADPTKIDYSIVNPAKLSPPLREAVCNQCHLQGERRVERAGRKMEQYRPGLPISDFMTYFVRNPVLGEKNKAVGQVEQMNSSACFVKTGGKLGCISCHDPHMLPGQSEKVDYYRNKCLNCHKGDPSTTVKAPPKTGGGQLASSSKTDPTGGISPPCSLPPEHRLARRNDCAACHLPRRASSDVAHTSLSDHRILRNPSDIHAEGRGLKQGELPLVPFPPRDLPEPDRDMTIALTQVTLDVPMAKATLLPLVARRLDELVKQHPGDFELWTFQAERLTLENRLEESLKIWERLRSARPEDEATLQGCCLAALRAGQKDRAAELSQRLLRMAPENVGHIMLVGDTLKSLGRYQDAIPILEQGVRNQPASAQLRKLLVECLVRAGRTEEVRAQMELLVKISRQGEGDLRRWFARLLAEPR